MGVLKVKVGGVWEPLGLSGTEAHAPTHETGGSDPVDNLDASVLQSGTLAEARLPATVVRNPAGASAQQIAVYTGTNDRVIGGSQTILDSGGNLNLLGSLTVQGGRIHFPTTAVNPLTSTALYDYRHGGFAPTLIDSAGGAAAAYYDNSGEYVRIGKLVFIEGRVFTQNKGTLTSSSANLAISNLPFPVISSVHSALAIPYWTQMPSNTVSVGAFSDAVGRFTILYTVAGGQSGVAYLQGSQIGNVIDLIFTGMYYTST